MRELIALVTGLVFGIGLMLSGMTNPLKIKGFLDVAGSWDPSLAFVMAGAIAVASVAYAVARRRTRSWTGDPMDIPQGSVIDRRLIGGGILFGAGWGLAGLCPGPALVNLGTGDRTAALFVLAMLVGMLFNDLVLRRRPATGRAGARAVREA